MLIRVCPFSWFSISRREIFLATYLPGVVTLFIGNTDEEVFNAPLLRITPHFCTTCWFKPPPYKIKKEKRNTTKWNVSEIVFFFSSYAFCYLGESEWTMICGNQSEQLVLLLRTLFVFPHPYRMSQINPHLNLHINWIWDVKHLSLSKMICIFGDIK